MHDRTFLDELVARHGLDLTQDDLDLLRACDAAREQDAQRRAWELRRGTEPVWMAQVDLNSGPALGILTAGIAGGASTLATTGAFSWIGAAIGAAGALVQSLLKPKQRQQKEDERFNQTFGIENGGTLAPAGTTMPMIYGNRDTGTLDGLRVGGARVGGILIHSRIVTKLGTNTLYQLYAISLGQSPQLGWGQLGRIADEEALFNKQPRSNFTAREIESFTREGFQNQTAIADFPYYSQTWTPPDYAVFGVDLRGKVAQANPLADGDYDNTTNVTLANGAATKTAGAAAWDAGAFGADPLNISNLFVFTVGTLTEQKAAGLSNVDADQDWVSIEHGFYVDGTGAVWVAESGVLVQQVIPVAATDTLAVQITAGGGIEYFQNGASIYVSAIAPALPLYPDIALFTPGSSFTGLATSVGGIGAVGGQATVFSLEDEDDHELFDPAEDYTLCDGLIETDSTTFRIIAKDPEAHTVTTDEPIALAGGNDIYAYWVAKYENTSRVNETHFNLVFSVSSREGNQGADNYGELKVHAVAFDLWMRPVTDPLGSEQLVIRFIVRSKNPSPIRRGFNVKNLALGRYYYELRPLCTMPCDRAIYELTDSGTCTTDATAVVVAGRQVQIEAELSNLYTPPDPNAPLPPWTQWPFVGNRLTNNGDGTFTAIIPSNFDSPETNCAYSPYFDVPPVVDFAAPAIGYDGTITISDEDGESTCGVTFDASGNIFYDDGGNTINVIPYAEGDVMQIGPNGVTQNGTLIIPCSLADVPTSKRWRVEVCAEQGTSPQLFFTLPDEGQEICDNLSEEMGYEGKTQISSESGPTGRIASVNEVVLPSEINIPVGGGANAYPGIALQGYKFLASERLQQPPGTRTSVWQGRIIPNLLAAGDASLLSTTTTLNDPTATFLTDGIEAGMVIRNLSLPNCYTQVTASTGGNMPQITVIPPHEFVTGDYLDLFAPDPIYPGSVQRVGRYQVVSATVDTINLQFISGTPAPTGPGFALLAKDAQIDAVSETTVITSVPLRWQEKSRYLIYQLAASPYFPDIFADAIANDHGGLRSIIDPDEYIDYESLVYARKFCAARAYFWNGVIESPTALQQWATKECIGSLLLPYKRDGRWGLVPDELTEPVMVFNAANSREVGTEWQDWQDQIINRLIVRYTDGRDLFQQDGARFRSKTITIWTDAAYVGLELPREETLDLEHVNYPEQAIAVGVTYLKSKRLQNRTITLETTYDAVYLQAGEIIRVQHPSIEVGEELSGFVRQAGEFVGGTQSVLLDCQPCLAEGYTTAPSDTGAISNQTNFLATAATEGDLLINTTTGQAAIITELTEFNAIAPLPFAEDDCYQILNLTTPTDLLASVTHRADGNTQDEISFTFELVDGAVWVRMTGLLQPLQPLDTVNIGGTDSLWRIRGITSDGKSSFKISATFHPGAELYSRDGLVIEFDDITV